MIPENGTILFSLSFCLIGFIWKNKDTWDSPVLWGFIFYNLFPHIFLGLIWVGEVKHLAYLSFVGLQASPNSVYLKKWWTSTKGKNVTITLLYSRSIMESLEGELVQEFPSVACNWKLAKRIARIVNFVAFKTRISNLWATSPFHVISGTS